MGTSSPTGVCGVGISAITNAHTGTGAAVKVSGTPSGTLTFSCARAPEVAAPDRLSVTATQTGTGPLWTLSFPAPGGWYLWTNDDNGACRAPAYVSVGVTDTPLLNEVGEWLRDTLIRHKPALQDALIPVFGKATAPPIEQIVFGLANLVETYPAIVVEKPEKDEQWYGTDALKLVRVSFEITTMMVHLERQAQMLPAVSRLGSRISEILNLPLYRSIVLPSGIALGGCLARSLAPTEIPVEGIGWGAEATVPWSAETTFRQSI